MDYNAIAVSVVMLTFGLFIGLVLGALLPVHWLSNRKQKAANTGHSPVVISIVMQVEGSDSSVKYLDEMHDELEAIIKEQGAMSGSPFANAIVLELGLKIEEP